LRRIYAAAIVLGALVGAAAAQAAPVQEFSFQVKDVRPDGRFTVAFTSRTYDTTGGVPPLPNEFHLRLPRGAKLRREFLSRRVLCDVKQLDRTRDPKACRRSQVGTGRVTVDARPFIADPIPADIWLFLAKGRGKDAVASLAVLGKQDQDAPVVRDIPVVRDFRAPIVFIDFIDDPTPDGKYGYKLVFANDPTGGGASFSIAETRVVTTGFTLTKRTRRCARRRGGACVKRVVRRRRIFWFTAPACPPSGRVSFEAFFGYASLPDIRKVTELPCPRFSR
jgi:hypothetical protein